ncbi:hypothetical protein [Leptolyngbya sp. KIOST-1]|uniref:hypothetical protein n=1 Tax=Leptolyngbya sp. KIOST-1 TaxID=1229172 RepID=UPI000A65BE09|nr:hypothetical protein [Leptolyngbya sp. KIOST-1]
MPDAASMFDKLAQSRQKAKAPPAPEPAPEPAPAPETPPKKRQRKATGKRSDPNYIQVGAYVPIELNKAVKRLLVDQDQDFSELVSELLERWVQENNA